MDDCPYVSFILIRLLFFFFCLRKCSSEEAQSKESKQPTEIAKRTRQTPVRVGSLRSIYCPCLLINPPRHHRLSYLIAKQRHEISISFFWRFHYYVDKPGKLFNDTRTRNNESAYPINLHFGTYRYLKP